LSGGVSSNKEKRRRSFGMSQKRGREDLYIAGEMLRALGAAQGRSLASIDQKCWEREGIELSHREEREKKEGRAALVSRNILAIKGEFRG